MKPSATVGQVSRRFVVTAVGSAALTAGASNNSARASTDVDPAVVVVKAWLATNDEEARLVSDWNRVESWLAENFEWFSLREEEQNALPAAKELFEIDAKFATLDEQRRLHERLLTTTATTFGGALCKLQVVAELAAGIDSSAHRLLVAAIDELAQLVSTP